MTEKRKPGRPRVAPAEKSVHLNITLAPALAERLRDDPDGPSKAVARMILAGL